MLQTLITLFLATSAVAAPTTDEINQFLGEFYQNPESAIERDFKTNRESLFDATDVLTDRFYKRKMQLLDALCIGGCANDKSADGYEVGNNDFFEGEEPPVRNIFELESFKTGKIAADIWSGSFWPLKKGGIAYRYRGGGPSSGVFSSNYRRREWPPRPYSASDFDDLSPAEKYDVLVGDPNYTLANFEWERGKYNDDNGSRVQSWEGYCHGWAMAAINEKRPLNVVKVKSPSGRSLHFYPSDLKALSTSMWANSLSNLEGDRYHWAGARCRRDRPARDRNGRILDPACNDVNPGLFHTILVNLIGMRQESFIFDASYDSEVWNYPVHGYSLTYFNPNRRRGDQSLQSAVIPIEQFTRDRFRAYRSPEAKYVVGVAVTMNYLRVQSPSSDSSDQRFNNRMARASYYYDLELDENYNIIGGEWYQRKHPDIMWRPKPNTAVGNSADQLLNELDLANGELPQNFGEAVVPGSKKGIPSSKIIRQLIELAQ